MVGRRSGEAPGQTKSVPGAIDEPERLLRVVPFFADLARVDVARLVGALEEWELAGGTRIFDEGAAADGLYLLERGTVEVSVRTAEGERALAEFGPGAHFGELGILLAGRTGSARTRTAVKLWKLPRERFERLVRERPWIGLAVATSLAELVDRRSRQHVGAPLAPGLLRPIALSLPQRHRPLGWRLAGLALAVGLPGLLWGLQPPTGLSAEGWHVSLILLGAGLGWLFEPLPDFVVTLAMVAAWGVAGLVPLSLAFAGFTSPSWLLAVGALALAAAMAHSGLSFRIALLLLKGFPPTHVGQVLALLLGGVLVTPLVPLALARVATVASLAQELARALGYPARSRASAALSFAGIIGYGSFSSLFLTGLAMNFFVLDLLPLMERGRFGWLIWLASASVAGAVVLVGATAVLLLFFRPEVAPRTSREVLRRQERALGPLTRAELVTIAAAAVLVVGLIAQPLLHVGTEWLAIGAIIVAMAGSGLDRERFRVGIDWGFLMLFGVLLGAGGVLRGAGVDRWIGETLLALSSAVGDPGALVVLLAAFVVAVRVVVPWIPCTLLLSLALVPAAPQLGLSPWVVGFVVLVAANTWLHPSQSDFCRLAREVTNGELFTERQGLAAGLGITLVTLAAIAASVPYWCALGLLRP